MSMQQTPQDGIQIQLFKTITMGSAMFTRTMTGASAYDRIVTLRG